ncbi:hypothetical protein QE152_g25829 [Popillia japonica]|uniref:Double jelly roll-like domain-containing protein n=1 Tax=Popillia japonica TaxID=7064 RepID=A0AAW1K0I6_POPJA
MNFAFGNQLSNFKNATSLDAEFRDVEKSLENLKSELLKHDTELDKVKISLESCINQLEEISKDVAVTKASKAERVIRTPKEKLYKEFSLRGTYNWTTILDEITKQYNNTKHRTIGMKPKDVTAKSNLHDHIKVVGKQQKFSLNDVVRIRKHKSIFDKEYTPNWSTELFRIAKQSIQHQDVYTLPSESFIYIEGKFKHDAAGTGTCELTNNAYAFLFDQIRYEINGVEVDRCTKPGITSSIKGYISYGDNETKFLEMAGWCPNSKTQATISLNNKFNAYIPLNKTQPTISLNNKFNAYIPLKFFLGFAEDYKKIIINASQELILLRSGNDLNCYHNTNTGGTKVASFDIDKIEWHVPHINVNDEIRLKLLKTLNSNKSIYMPFRKCKQLEKIL